MSSAHDAQLISSERGWGGGYKMTAALPFIGFPRKQSKERNRWIAHVECIARSCRLRQQATKLRLGGHLHFPLVGADE